MFISQDNHRYFPMTCRVPLLGWRCPRRQYSGCVNPTVFFVTYRNPIASIKERHKYVINGVRELMHGVKTFVIISLAKGCATNNMGLNLPIQIHADLHLGICIDHPAIAMAIITHASMENCHVMGFSIDGKISNRETIFCWSDLCGAHIQYLLSGLTSIPRHYDDTTPYNPIPDRWWIVIDMTAQVVPTSTKPSVCE